MVMKACIGFAIFLAAVSATDAKFKASWNDGDGSATFIVEKRPQLARRVGMRERTVRDRRYRQLYRDIAASLADEDHADGWWAGTYIRLAWHESGTFDRRAGDGGWTHGATMRFGSEKNSMSNRGLEEARQRLRRVRQNYMRQASGRNVRRPSIADVWSLAAVASVQESGGPTIKWRAGRVDAVGEAQCPPDGRLPDVVKHPTAKLMSAIFRRMGFSDREMVALIGGGHSLGRFNKGTTGFHGAWTADPTKFSNDYFKVMLGRAWFEHPKTPNLFTERRNGKGKFSLVTNDLELSNSPRLLRYTRCYARSRRLLYRDFAAAFSKLIHLGMKK